MKVKYDFNVRDILGDYVLVPVGEAALKFQSMITTNEVGVTIWNAIKDQKNPEEILGIVMDEYEIDEQTAKADITKFINALNKLDIIEI